MLLLPAEGQLPSKQRESPSAAGIVLPIRPLMLIAGHGLFQSLADESLIGNTPCPGTALDRLQQRLRQPHVDPRPLLLEFEPNRFCAGKVIFRQIGGGDEGLRLFVTLKAWDSLFHSAEFHSCAC